MVPLHSFKHAATMQHLLPHNPHPLLIRIDKKAGHGSGKSTEKRCAPCHLETECYSDADNKIMCAESKRQPINGDSLHSLSDSCGDNSKYGLTIKYQFEQHC